MSDVIIVTGQTASGKSDYAYNLARQNNGVIINSDAMQVYKDTPILSSAPFYGPSSSVEHVLYGTMLGLDKLSVARWIGLVSAEVKKATSSGRVPIIVGGSPLYNRMIVDGINSIPEIEEQVKAATLLMQKDEIYSKLIEQDPLSKDIDRHNRHRILRAYQVWLQTGKSIYFFHQQPKKSVLSGHSLDKRLIVVSKERLYENCEKRFKQMLDLGAVDEVKSLYNRGYSGDEMVFNVIGVREIKQYLDGNILLDAAAELAITRTRQYAKKQATWFNNKFGDFSVVKL